MQVIGSRGTNGHLKPENKLINKSYFYFKTNGLMIFYFIAIPFQILQLYDDVEIQSNVYIVS